METHIPEALFIVFLLCLITQLYFVLVNQSKLKKYHPADELPPASIPVSVIISARNEAANLLVNLPLILEQNYPDFEVIVVNDCSYDGTEEILKGIKQKYTELKIVTITEHDRFKTGKKFALTLGIKAAKNEHLLFTDADCKPATEHWITYMAANFEPEVDIVLGYSPHIKTRNFLNPLIRFETIKTAINYLSAALRGNAYMGVGRNLAYTKTLFFSVKGFASHMHVLSGDDDLFVNQNATSTNTIIEAHPDSFVYTDAKTSIASLFRQKKRHSGAGKLYKGKHRRALTVDALSGFLFYILLTLSLVFNVYPLIALGLFMFRLIIQLIIYSKLFKRLDGKDLLWYFPFLDMIYYIYLNTFGFIGSFLKTNRWK